MKNSPDNCDGLCEGCLSKAECDAIEERIEQHNRDQTDIANWNDIRFG